MKMREILEGDRERLFAKLAKADTAERAVACCEDELSRMLLTYQESAPSAQAGELASSLMEMLRAALTFADCSGDVRTYERIGGSGESRRSPVPAGLLALVCLTACGAVNVLAPKTLWVLAVVLAAAACFFCLRCGTLIGAAKAKPAQKELITEVLPEPEKLYRTLLACATVADQLLDDAYLAERKESGELHLAMDRRGNLPEEELSLLTSVLESAYAAEAEDDAAQGIISEIRFYLHKRGNEMEERNDSHVRWFTRMPGSRRRTLRPALVQDQTVLVKGLASGSFGEE